VSENRGVDFVSSVGMIGTTKNTDDMGYPQVSLGGLFNNIGYLQMYRIHWPMRRSSENLTKL